jgi:2-polyprenyl-3-methyl-5-hydroxy-6-metoxy-1,4-benzoquinol methylase
MQKFYPASYYQAPREAGFDKYLERRFTAEASYLQELKSRISSPKLLDVGCSNGEFPRFMAARGWDVSGVEVSETSSGITDFPFYNMNFQDVPVDTPTFEAVTAWAVLEHVHDPMAYFQKAAQVLKQNGLFVFLVTNFHSVASRKLFGEDIPRHLYFFTRETVQQYLQKTGFALVKEDNGRNVHKMAPTNWLSYLMQTKLKGKPFTCKDAPLGSREFRKLHNLPRGISASLKYAAYSPASVINRILLPAIEAGQILRRTYGISTYVARKR